MLCLSGTWNSRDGYAESSDNNLYRATQSDPVGTIDYLGLDVWTENSSSALSMHKRICVETKSADKCACNCQKTIKWCVGFAPDSMRGSASGSSDSSRSSESDMLNIDSSTAALPPNQTPRPARVNPLGLREGVLPPGMIQSTGDLSKDNGIVSMDMKKNHGILGIFGKRTIHLRQRVKKINPFFHIWNLWSMCEHLTNYTGKIAVHLPSIHSGKLNEKLN